MTRTTAGPILVAAFVLIWIGVSVIALSVQAASPTMKRRVAIGVTVFLCFVLILWWLEQSLTVQAAAPLPQLHFWIAVFLAKWPPSSVPYSSRNFWSALAIGITVLLNVGLYATLLDLWRRVRKGTTMRMQLTTSLDVRDALAKAEIYESKTFHSLSEADQEKLEELIEGAFDRADAKWRTQFVPPHADIEKITLG